MLTCRCGKQFLRYNSAIRQYKILFCSRACFNVWNKGANHSKWKGGITKRGYSAIKVVKDRLKDIWWCERCGSTQHLHGHHIKPVSTHPELSGDPTNIVVLCSVCHGREHPSMRNMITRPQVRSGGEVVCIVCARLRYVYPSDFNVTRFCSRQCVDEARRQGVVRAGPVQNGNKIPCAFCGKAQYARPGHTGRKFCNQACMGLFRRDGSRPRSRFKTVAGSS
jgi:hypothetical protein